MVRTISEVCKPQIRIIHKYNKPAFNHFISSMSQISLSMAVVFLLLTYCFGRYLLSYFFGSAYVVAFPEFCVAIIGFVLVEGLVVYKLAIEQIYPRLIGKIVSLTNVVSVILIFLGAYFSFFWAVMGFTTGRILYTLLVVITYKRKIALPMLPISKREN